MNVLSPNSANKIRINEELTSIHEEVLRNLNSIHGALLCMNRSIQAEGTFGIIKCDKSYKRLRRKGLDSVLLEFILVFILLSSLNLILFIFGDTDCPGEYDPGPGKFFSFSNSSNL